MNSFEEILARDGVLVYKTRGRSMEPLLREGRDLVTIRRADAPLQKYDVALYRRGEQYVLHRVIRVLPDGYLIRGDNTYTLETVPSEAVIGVVEAFKRRGRDILTSNRLYGLYTRFWTWIYPIRLAAFRLVRALKALLRKLGITPILKRLIRHE